LKRTNIFIFEFFSFVHSLSTASFLRFCLSSEFIARTNILTDWFVHRAPESSPIKSKMIYAGTKDTIKKALQGLNVEIQGTDKSEVDYNEVLTKCQAVSK
jgi:hypothetical protein